MSAHRPTYFAAKARENQGGYKRWLPSTAVSSKALPAHLTLKRRQLGQNSAEELSNRDFRSELEMREKMSSSSSTTRTLALPTTTTTTTDQEEEDRINNFSADNKIFDPNADDQLLSSSDEEEDDEKNGTDSDSDDSDSDRDDDGSDDDDDDDEEAELERELEKIRRERAEEEMRRRQKQAEEEERENRQQVLMGNPLLKPITSRDGIDDENDDDEDDQFDDTRSVTSSVSSSTTSYALKRKWNDDTVFKNQAMDEPKIKKRFINDTIRSDFHKKFLEKYIK